MAIREVRRCDPEDDRALVELDDRARPALGDSDLRRSPIVAHGEPIDGGPAVGDRDMKLGRIDRVRNALLFHPCRELLRAGRGDMAGHIERGLAVDIEPRRELGRRLAVAGLIVVRWESAGRRGLIGLCRLDGEGLRGLVCLGNPIQLVTVPIGVADAFLRPFDPDPVELDVALGRGVEVLLVVELAIDMGRSDVGAVIPSR